jgi:hypothetical protein
MAEVVRLRRSTTAQHQSFAGAEGELTYDTNKKTVVVHDGNTDGGFPMRQAEEPVGWVKMEHFTSDGTWTKAGKDNLKRIIVTTYGGGGGGDNANWSAGGGQGGYGYGIFDVSNVTTNVSVTIGAGGSAGTAGGTTYFGSYVRSNGGATGNNNGSYMGQGGHGGNVTGTNTVDLGGVPGDGGMGYSATANSNFGTSNASKGGGPGAGSGNSTAATGCLGGGGAAAGAGADGSVIIEEIYGEY